MFFFFEDILKFIIFKNKDALQIMLWILYHDVTNIEILNYFFFKPHNRGYF